MTLLVRTASCRKPLVKACSNSNADSRREPLLLAFSFLRPRFSSEKGIGRHARGGDQRREKHALHTSMIQVSTYSPYFECLAQKKRDLDRQRRGCDVQGCSCQSRGLKHGDKRELAPCLTRLLLSLWWPHRASQNIVVSETERGTSK